MQCSRCTTQAIAWVCALQVGAVKLAEKLKAQPKIRANDLNLGKLTLFTVYLIFSIIIMVFFLIPFYSESGTRVTTGWRRGAATHDAQIPVRSVRRALRHSRVLRCVWHRWREACDNYDEATLAKFGLS